MLKDHNADIQIRDAEFQKQKQESDRKWGKKEQEATKMAMKRIANELIQVVEQIDDKTVRILIPSSGSLNSEKDAEVIVN